MPESSTAHAAHPHRAGLRVIAVYEIIKTTCLVLIAAAAFHLDRTQNFEQLVHWLKHLPLTDSSGLRWRLVSALVDFGPSRFVAIGMVSLGYAVLFGIEGIGLLMGKYWAEWFTVIATSSLIPLELYEVLMHFGWLQLAALVGNIVIVIYLVRVAVQTREARKVLARTHSH
ncbi:DUF2127 domain-containing protein [Dyella sp. A6]|uniref:DUF2127 domain-containing protein n=1 Tax=Dyella aluminiiresistens TaxID=3069105 RepID=UPI002E7A711D|nr:DUF2127 domain-containing protein [Dyella sp. A6]